MNPSVGKKKKNRKNKIKVAPPQDAGKKIVAARRRQRRKPVSPGGLIQATDTRTARMTRDTLDPTTQQPSITIEIALDPTTVLGVCLSYVSRALSRGYLAHSDLPEDPYYAVVYMVNVLLAYARGTVPSASSLPYWLQCFGQALAPKRVKMNEGIAFYRFTTTASIPFIPLSDINVGSIIYGYQYLLYKEGSGDVDLFPKAAPSTGYTDEDGSRAWSSLAQFMQESDHPWTRVVPLTTTTWSKNVSAFAMPTVPEGQGYSGSGGEVFVAGLEVPVHTPCLGVFAKLLENGAINPARYAIYSTLSAGDPLFASAFFHGLAPTEQIGTKKATKFHSVDFLEFQDVLATWAALVVGQAFKDSAFAPTVSGTPLDAVCPITLQEMGLILRNEMMNLYNSTQCADQAIYPREVASALDNEFVPFLCSSTTVSLGSQGMKLPLMLVENMKALVGRWVKTSTQNEMFFCPILGQYAYDVLSTADYTATTTGTTPVTIEVFPASPSLLRRRHVVRTKSSTAISDVAWEPEIEAPISFIDGSSGSDYCFINDPKRIEQLVSLWNEWASRYSTYSMAYTVASKDLGVNVCSSVGITRHWIPQSDTDKRRQAEVRDMRLESRRYLSATLYAGREAIVTTSFNRMTSAVYDQIESIWILSVNKATSGGTDASQSIFQREQIIKGETASVSNSSESTGVAMSTLHGRYAQAMIKGTNAPPSEIEVFFVEQSKNARAGILSGLVAGFIGKAFGSTAGSIAGSISEMLPV